MNRSRTFFDRPRAARCRAPQPAVEPLEGRLLLSGAAEKVGGIRYGTPEEVFKATRQPGNSPDVPFLNTPPPVVTVQLFVNDDPFNTNVAAAPRVKVAGFVSEPFATVWLGRGPRGAFTTTTVAAQNGYYEFEIKARPGDNLVRVFAGAKFVFSKPIDFHFSLGDPVVAWDAVAVKAVAAAGLNGPEAARDLALLHVAQYDAIASIRSPGSAFRGAVTAPRGASEAAAANAAAQVVLKELFPLAASSFDAQMAAARAGLPKNKATRDGMRVGREVAAATLAWRAQDQAIASASGWGSVAPFAISSVANFLPGPPPAAGSAAYDAALEEVLLLGEANSTARTARQTLTAQFWNTQSYPPSGPGIWNQAAERIAVRSNRSLWSNARRFAMLDVAMADAEIVAAAAKSTYDVGRPITAIHQFDPSWVPLLPTPPTPSYVSGQAASANAAATILASEFGSGSSVVVTSPALGSTRVYDTAQEAALDAGMSGVYGGVQFSFDVTAGSQLGDSVARDVLAKFPRPKR